MSLSLSFSPKTKYSPTLMDQSGKYEIRDIFGLITIDQIMYTVQLAHL